MVRYTIYFFSSFSKSIVTIVTRYEKALFYKGLRGDDTLKKHRHPLVTLVTLVTIKKEAGRSCLSKIWSNDYFPAGLIVASVGSSATAPIFVRVISIPHALSAALICWEEYGRSISHIPLNSETVIFRMKW